MASEDLHLPDHNSVTSLSEEALFFNLSLDLLAIAGTNGYFRRVNQAWTHTLGYSEAELTAQPFIEFVHPDDRASTLAELERLKAGTPTLSFENRYRAKDGSYRCLSWTASPQVERGELFCVARDVTQQKATEAALQTANETLEQRVAERTAELQQANQRLHESERLFRAAIDHIPDVFVIYDAERRIQFVNAAGLTLTGRPLSDFIGYRDEDVQPPEVTEVYLPLLRRAVETKQYETGECTIALPNREPYTIVVQYVPLLNEQGDIRQILGITYDITERKQAEELVRQSEQQMRRVLDSLYSFVGVMTPDGTLIEANRTALDAANLQPADVLGRPFVDAYWWSYDAEVQTQLRRAIAQAVQGETIRYDAVVRVRDRHLITIDFTIVPIFNAAGQVEYLIPSGIDISDRKQAELALLESRMQVQRQLAEIETIYQSAPIGLNVLDRDLRFVRINERLAEINGLSVAEHIGRTVRELLPDLADTAENLLRPVLETGEPLLNVEIRGETPAQPGIERVWLESFLPLMEGDRVIGINTVCEEITDRIQAEAALRESAAQFRQMADHAPVMVWVTDPTGYCTFLSQSWYDFTGQTEAEGLGFGWLDATHPDDFREAQAAFMEANRRQTAFRLEYRLRRHDGAYRWAIDAASPWFGAQGEFKGYIGSVIDITERKQAEAALRHSEERYRTLFETMEDGFCILQMLFDADQRPIDYRFLEANPAFEQQTGLRDPVGHTARQLIPDLEEYWFETYGNVALTREPLRFEQGSEVMNRWFEVYAFPIGAIDEYKVALLFKNVSDRKAIETQRERLLQQEQTAREAAERANRMKDEFLAVLSHELRTPLNPILGWVKILQSSRIDSQRLQQGLQTIERNAQQQTQLINDLLDVSRIIRGQLSLDLKVIDPAEPVLNALETVHFSAEAKDIEMEVSIDQSVGLIRGDESRLQQVVWNLLSNAIKFTPKAGRIMVSLTPIDDSVQIQVRDTGQGIHPDFLSQVFTLFKQQDSSITRSFGGLGLGLAIVKQIVEAHGGTIIAESAGEGQGATFTVQLPLLPVLQTDASEATHAETKNLENSRVIAVDDEADSLELLKVILEQEGAVISTFSSAAAALQALAQAPFDLLISDIGMPDIDGYELVTEIRAASRLNQAIPAIALTAFAGERNQKRAIAAGYQAHIAKPINPQTLLEVSSKLITA